MELIHNRCIFTDRQIVRLQEAPSQIPEGETPHTTTLFAFDDVVDAVRPGDRVEVTGIFRAIPRRVHPRVRTCKSLFRTYIDSIHFRKKGDERDDVADVIDDDPSKPIGPQFSSDRIRQIERFARDGEAPYEKLVRALAPSIYGMEDVKRGVLCMLFGGCARLRETKTEDGPRDGAVARTGVTPGARSRGDINVLMCGDPGTSKSQLLSYVHKIAPRGVYTSGKGSSAVGLTASVQRDPETRELVMESGAVVLSDLGICCIDEFDKMSDMTRAVLHEAMEQQTISLAKAGIVATLNARASIFAAANPVDSRYNPRLSVVENIQLPPTLLSRFDLIYLILDNPDRDSDRRLAKHIVELYLAPPEPGSTEEQARKVQAPADERFLRDYVAFARARIHPELGPEARSELVDAYVRMRGGGSARPNRGRAITATPRQLEGMIRISEALCRMRLETRVTKADVLEAVRLMQVATLAAATDASTGLIDMDAIATGRTASDRALHESLCRDLKKIMEARPRGTPVSIAEIRDEVQRDHDGDLDQLAFLAALRSLAAEDAIMHSERAATVLRR
jgi:DNA replication licensing factor MCM4